MNLGRRLPNRIGNASWAVTYAWFYEPQYFGDVYFGGHNALTAELQEVAPPHVGENPLTVQFVNHSASTASADIRLILEEVDGKQTLLTKEVSIPAGGRLRQPLTYVLPDGTLGIVTLEVAESGCGRPFLRQSIAVNVPANRATLDEAQCTLGRVRDRLAAGDSLAPRWIWQSLVRLESEAKKRRAQLAEAETSVAEWHGLASPLERLLGRAQKLKWWLDHDVGDAAFAVGKASTLEKLLRDRAFAGPLADEFEIAAARGEYEGLQLVLIPGGDELADVSLAASDLRGPRGATIPSGKFEFQWVDFVETRQPRHPIDYIGWFPDPLIPMTDARRTVPIDRLHQPVWVSLHIPYGTPAGVYTGTVEVRVADGAHAVVPVRVRVYDFDLPRWPALKTVFWLNEGYIRDWNGWDEIPEHVRRNEMAFLLRYRVNPATGWNLLEPIDNFEFALERGLNAVQLGSAPSWPLPEATLARIERHYSYLKEQDLLDMAFIYAHDEPDPSLYPDVRHTMEQIGKHFPGLNRVCTASPPAEGLEGAIDTWVVTANAFNYEAVAARQAAGDELWFYGGPTMKRPYTNWYVDYTGIEERMTFWHCWKYQAKGLLHWCLDQWGSNMVPWSGDPAIDRAIALGKRWPEVPWNAWTYLNVNGEAQLVYPGPEGAFWSSVRLEIFRDGMEDYDYFAVLQSLQEALEASDAYDRDALVARSRALLTIGPAISSDLATFTKNSEVMFAHRNEVATHIERLRHRLQPAGSHD
ncbi:MAG TPA: glycoside hydrolase domain-containing protein [Armatimonadota bacterium]|nr:glycoside hydrolase domain-containing protein [Armatimonadota bacterium]